MHSGRATQVYIHTFIESHPIQSSWRYIVNKYHGQKQNQFQFPILWWERDHFIIAWFRCIGFGRWNWGMWLGNWPHDPILVFC